MRDYPALEVNAYYRAGHSTVWELADKAGILGQLGIILKSLEYCGSSSKAESGLFSGAIDFVAGNHITPYLWVARGRPLVALASPSNWTRDMILSRQPISSVADLKGKRLADQAITDAGGGYHHIRGNHMLEVMRGGLALDDVEWVDVGDPTAENDRIAQIEAVRKGEADATISMGSAEAFRQEGFSVLELEPLPMINGPTITTSIETLYKREGLGERLVKAMIMTIHYARMHPEEAGRFLGASTNPAYEVRPGGRVGSVSRIPIKPYPDTEAVANAYQLCCMQYPETTSKSPLALWDTHYLRELDMSGFIDELIEEEPKQA